MKPRIFIGSSKEGLKYVKYLEAKLADHADCYVWSNENVFLPNKGILDTLVKQAKLSDFALLIATKDDVTTSESRPGERITARDNVIFEHGLFLGATSIDRAFLFIEQGVNLPSDFNGVSTLTFSETIGTYNHIDIICEQLIERIRIVSNQSELGFVPSTALAIGYFTSFIKRVCEEIGKSKFVEYNGKNIPIKSYKFKVILPDNIDDDGVYGFLTRYNQNQNLEKAATAVVANSVGRGYPFHFKIDPPEQDMSGPIDVHIFDVPTTINTILESIKLYFPVGYVGLDVDREHIEKRELNNFANVLRYYINKNSWTRGHVEVEENIKI